MDNNELSATIASLMNDSRVADTIKQLKASLSDSQSSETPKAETPASNTAHNEKVEIFPDIGALTKLLSVSEKNPKGSDSETEKRNRLLSALKPYLSENRQDVIDKIMSLSNLTGLIDLFPKSNS